MQDGAALLTIINNLNPAFVRLIHHGFTDSFHSCSHGSGKLEPPPQLTSLPTPVPALFCSSNVVPWN